MKIAIIGHSGSGKSTLARGLAEKYRIPVLHFDAVQFLPDWEIRPEEEKQRMTQAFLDANAAWVIDGNYSKLSYERRMAEADVIVVMLFNRWHCLWRVTKRYLRYKNKTRPDMAAGCKEKLDREFVRWILRDGRSQAAKDRYGWVLSKYAHKAVVVKNQRQLNKVQNRIDQILQTAS